MSAVLEVEQTIAKAPTDGVKQRLITVAEYERMIEQEILIENNSVELLNGLLMEKVTKGIRHAALNDLIGDLFRETLGRRVYVRLQNPIVLDDLSEPEPDVVVCKPPRQTYFKRHPLPEDIFLILEIADTILLYDRNDKAPLYAKAGIQQYLLLDVKKQTIEDYRDPSADGYQFRQTLRVGQNLNLVAFPEIEIAVDEFLLDSD
jgi:Uma2 family endonuclease